MFGIVYVRAMEMTQKKLQEKSIYADYDEDGDIVSDAELAHAKEIKEVETALEKFSPFPNG